LKPLGSTTAPEVSRNGFNGSNVLTIEAV
jgi:hypothetical protein